MEKTPAHLGGHLHRTWIDPGALQWAKEHFGVRSLVDVGCGPCGMAHVAQRLNIRWFGIDGDPLVASLLKTHGGLLWDFQKGTPPLKQDFDLAWCVEFLEHVEERYQPAYMGVFKRCQVVICTAAPPGWEGHHHVNLRPQEYWHAVFSRNGFDFKPGLTAKLRRFSTMKDTKRGPSFMKNTGMVYKKRQKK